MSKVWRPVVGPYVRLRGPAGEQLRGVVMSVDAEGYAVDTPDGQTLTFKWVELPKSAENES